DLIPPGDTAPPPDSEAPPDATDPPPCQGPGLFGQVVQEDGTPIGGTKLFLCGVVNGAETCNPRTADASGRFSFQALAPGYTHLEVNATLAGIQLGTQFAGYSLQVDPSGPDCVDMGLITLPELPAGDAMATAAGGTVTAGPVTVELPAGCPVFPDFSPEAPVGVLLLDDPAAAYWAPPGTVLAVAFHPFKAHCAAGAAVRLDGTAGLAAPRVLYNDLLEGGATDAGPMVADRGGWVLEAAVPDLTWIWITD
ncbi:MAG: hypothetical protein FJ098_06450, partial [Deltaproteobacteria bacterium]|nr:hypothetical protein [Deltaproteobacteria bacterium]